MSGKVRQLLSYELSARKRKAKRTFSEALGLNCLRSRNAVYTDEQVQAKSNDIQRAKKKLLTKHPLRTWDLSHCRESVVTGICKLGMKDAVQCWIALFSGDTLLLFWHQIAIFVFHQLMGFDSQRPGSSAIAEIYAETFLVAHARLVAFITITIVSLRFERTISIQLAVIVRNWTTKRSSCM